MAIRVAKITIKGISPLMTHRFPTESIEAIEKQPKEIQAEHAAYRIPDTNELYVPGVAVQRALINGAKYSKGKGRASLAVPAAACFMVTPEYLGLKTKEYIIDSRSVVIPSTRGRVMRHRPKFNEWEISFELQWDDALISDKQARTIVDDTGSRVGLLEFNPVHKGNYGRFVVNTWEVLKP